jgi:hypothetical protein
MGKKQEEAAARVLRAVASLIEDDGFPEWMVLQSDPKQREHYFIALWKSRRWGKITFDKKLEVKLQELAKIEDLPKEADSGVEYI